MKKIVLLLVLLPILGCTSSEVVINGDIPYVGNQEVVLFIRDSSLARKEIARVKAFDNKFTFTSVVDKPTYASIGFAGSEIRLVLEPGKIEIVGMENVAPIVKGTKYNEMLYKWRKAPEFGEIEKERAELYEITSRADYDTNASDSLRRAVISRHRSCFARENAIENKELEAMLASDDSYAKFFAIVHGQRFLEEQLPLLAEIEGKIGKNPEIDYIRKVIAERNELKELSKNIVVGKPFIEVIGSTASDEVVKLSEIIAKNKFTLLEFWASWCAPCRKEIPHLKQAYDKYHSKGFEIFSYSIDADHQAWLKADKDEDLRWISLSGTAEQIAEVSKMYVVSSIPASVLIDAQGKIVALNLRGEQLQEFLKSNL